LSPSVEIQDEQTDARRQIAVLALLVDHGHQQSQGQIVQLSNFSECDPERLFDGSARFFPFTTTDLFTISFRRADGNRLGLAGVLRDSVTGTGSALLLAGGRLLW
jgi:hypothetical protein